MRTLTLYADAKEINRLHGEIMAAVRTTLEKAIRVGELLTKCRTKCQHGDWLPWLKANVQMDQKSVWRYMQIFEHREKLGNLPNLTEALQLINEVRVADKKAKAPKDKPEPQAFGKNVTIFEGNCLDILPTLEAESVQMVCTSPPFYNLRDYGTAKWEGGSPKCDHVQSYNLKRDHNGSHAFGLTRGTEPSRRTSIMRYRDVCGKCGALRIDNHQLGLEKTPEQYIENLVKVFREIRRVLKADGTLWLNLGSVYASENAGNPNAPETISMRHGNGKRGRPEGYNPGRDAKAFGYKRKDLIPIPWLVGIALQKDGWWLRNDCILEKLNPMTFSGEDRCCMSHEYVLLLAKSEQYYFDYQAVQEPANPQ